MLQTMTSLRKDWQDLNQRTSEKYAASPTPSQADQQEFSIVLQGKVQIASRREREREREHSSKQLKPNQGAGVHNKQMDKVTHPLPGPHGKDWAVLGSHSTQVKTK